MPPAYVDDLAFVIYVTVANGLERIRKALQIVVVTFAQFGLTVNLSPGKTEVLLFYRGPRSNHLRRFIEQSIGNTIQFTGPNGCAKKASIVNGYEHVGTKIVPSFSILPEIKSRSHSIKVASGPLMRNILRNPKISLERRTTLAMAI